MKCIRCWNQQNLICKKCYEQSLGPKIKIHEENKGAILQYLNSINQRFSIKIKTQLKEKLQKQAVVQRIEKLKLKIKSIQEKIEEEKQIKQTRMQIYELHKDISEQIHKDSSQKEGDVKKLYLNELVKKNFNLQNQIVMMKREKLQILRRIMEICKFGWNKYFLKKWLKFEKVQKMVFTLTSQEKGIPVLVGEKQQKIVFNSQDSQQFDNLNLPIHILVRLNQIIFDNTRFAIFIKDLFVGARIPYKMFFSLTQSAIYIGDKKIRLIYDEKQNISSFLQVINLIQANIEYLYTLIGHEQGPLLIIQSNFFSFLKKSDFRLRGFHNKKKQWKSNLKQLRMDKIEDEQDVEIGIAQIKSSNRDEDDDDFFQILQ